MVTYKSLPAMSIPPPPPPPPGKTPRHTQGIWKNCSKIFCWQMPHPPFLLWWSNARSPSPSDQYTKLLVAIFSKHNSFSSIELHKTGHEMSHSNWQKGKADGFIAFIGLLWSINALQLLQNDSAWLTGCYERRFLLFANAWGGEHY